MENNKKMQTGAHSLDLIRDELFASMGEVEDLLQQYLEDRSNGSLLQQAIDGMQQLRGTLALVQLKGGALLLEEMVALGNEIPVHDGDSHNAALSAICDSLFLLQRYLPLCRQKGAEIPELLLPGINQLRALRTAATQLSDSHFWDLDLATIDLRQRPAGNPVDAKTHGRLRQMYQIGLLGLLRNENLSSCRPMLQRALQRLQGTVDARTVTLCWMADAALEAIEQTPLRLDPMRKRLFGRLDRELRSPGQASDESLHALVKELLYLVALGRDGLPLADAVSTACQLPLPDCTEAELESAFASLRGPGLDVMRSVAEALQEEIAACKDMLDLLARNAADVEQTLDSLGQALERLWKTLSMLNLNGVSALLRAAAQSLENWQAGDVDSLEQVADTILQVERAVGRLQSELLDPGSDHKGSNDAGNLPVELKEARIVLIDESQAGLALAKRSITAYLESGLDRMHLLNVPTTLESVRGALTFLGMSRAAAVVEQAARFIHEVMLAENANLSDNQLETLADALSGIEFYLDSSELSAVTARDILRLAEDSMESLGYPVGSDAAHD